MIDKIYVDIDENLNAILSYPQYNITTKAYIGKNGVTNDKVEGDGKTPLGEFDLGIVLSMNDSNYKLITENMYFVDDINSKYYNTLVDINNIRKDFSSAEHLIDFKKQYEYLVEIKSNPNNIPNKGSCVFLHCKNLDKTEGCVSIDKEILKQIITLIDDNTKIVIRMIK